MSNEKVKAREKIMTNKTAEKGIFTKATLSYIVFDLCGKEIAWIYTTDKGAAVPYYLDGKPTPELFF